MRHVKTSIQVVAVFLFLCFMAVVLPNTARHYDWSGERFASYCEYKYSGEVLDDRCFVYNTEGTTARVVATKDQFLEEYNK